MMSTVARIRNPPLPLRYRPDRSRLHASLRHRRSAGIFCDGYRLIRRSWPGFAQHYDDYD
jgi:hypothetical protein